MNPNRKLSITYSKIFYIRGILMKFLVNQKLATRISIITTAIIMCGNDWSNVSWVQQREQQRK